MRSTSRARIESIQREVSMMKSKVWLKTILVAILVATVTGLGASVERVGGAQQPLAIIQALSPETAVQMNRTWQKDVTDDKEANYLPVIWIYAPGGEQTVGRVIVTFQWYIQQDSIKFNAGVKVKLGAAADAPEAKVEKGGSSQELKTWMKEKIDFSPSKPYKTPWIFIYLKPGDYGVLIKDVNIQIFVS